MKKILKLYPGNLVHKIGHIAIEGGRDLVFYKPVPVRFSIASHSDRLYGILTQIYSGSAIGHPIHEFFDHFEPFPNFFALHKAIQILENMYVLNREYAKHAYFLAKYPHPNLSESHGEFFKGI